MPQTNNQRERGAGTKMPGGNAVAPSGVSGEFNKDGVSMVGALASVMGNTEPQIKIGQQGRIIDNGTGLYAALEGAAKGAANGLEQYDKMYRYTSEKIFNEWDISRLAYSATVNDSPSKMKEWTKTNTFKANDVNAKAYNTIIANTNLKDYNQYEIERFVKYQGEASLLTDSAAHALITEASGQTDSESPAWPRFQAVIATLNERLVGAGINARVKAREIAGNGELLNIGQGLRDIGVSPEELGSPYGDTIARAIMLLGNSPIEGDRAGIYVDSHGDIEFSSGGASLYKGSFNGFLKEELIDAIRVFLGESYNINDRESFNRLEMVMGAKFNAFHTSRHGNGSSGQPSTKAATGDMQSTIIGAYLDQTADAPTIIQAFLENGFARPLTEEEWAALGKNEVDRNGHNAELFNNNLNTVIDQLSGKMRPANVSIADFAYSQARIASNLIYFINNSDSRFANEYNPSYELSDSGDALRKLDVMRIKAFETFAAEASATIASEINGIGSDPRGRKWTGTPENPGPYPNGLPSAQIPFEQQKALDKYHSGMIDRLSALGVNFDVFNLGPNGELQQFDETNSPLIDANTPTLIAIRPMSGEMSGNPHAFVSKQDSTGEGSIFMAGSEKGSRLIKVELERRRELARQRLNATAVLQALNPQAPIEGPTVLSQKAPSLTPQDVKDATNWWIDHGKNGGNLEVALLLGSPLLGSRVVDDQIVSAPMRPGETPLYVTAIEAIVADEEYITLIAQRFDINWTPSTADQLAETFIRPGMALNQARTMGAILAETNNPTLYGAVGDALSGITKESRRGSRNQAEDLVSVLNSTVWAHANLMPLLSGMGVDTTEYTKGTKEYKQAWLTERFQDPTFAGEFWNFTTKSYNNYKAAFQRRAMVRESAFTGDRLNSIQNNLVKVDFDADILAGASFDIAKQFNRTATGDLEFQGGGNALIGARKVFKDIYATQAQGAYKSHLYTLVEGIDNGRAKRWADENPFDAAAIGMFGPIAQRQAIQIYTGAVNQLEAQMLTNPDGLRSYEANAKGDAGLNDRILMGYPTGTRRFDRPNPKSAEMAHSQWTSPIPSDADLVTGAAMRDKSGKIPVNRTIAVQKAMWGAESQSGLANSLTDSEGWELTQERVEFIFDIIRGKQIGNKSSREKILAELVYGPATEGASREMAIVMFNDRVWEDETWVDDFVSFCLTESQHLNLNKEGTDIGGTLDQQKELWKETIIGLRRMRLAQRQING